MEELAWKWDYSLSSARLSILFCPFVYSVRELLGNVYATKTSNDFIILSHPLITGQAGVGKSEVVKAIIQNAKSKVL